jgi:hypothetical protein
MIKLGECELDYPMMTRFKVWVGKREKHKPSVRADKACTSVRADGINEWVYMGEYGKAEMVKRFGDKWLDRGHENGIKSVEIYLI